MTFDQWHEDRFGFSVTQAERDNHKQLRNYRDCWGSAISCAKADHEAALAEAVAKAREACAELCDRFAQRGMHPAECAAAIHARSKP